MRVIHFKHSQKKNIRRLKMVPIFFNLSQMYRDFCHGKQNSNKIPYFVSELVELNIGKY